ncbi:MAG: lasso peptide biosynthesis B2 protein [Acidobacteriota bacterium]
MGVPTASNRLAASARRTPAVYLRGIEAASYLSAASLAIRFLPFRRLIPIFTRVLPDPELTGPARSRAIVDVRRAVRSAAARLPNRPVCFPQAVAAQAMLRRRGVGSTLCYGVNTGDGVNTADALSSGDAVNTGDSVNMASGRGLNAHVWLVAGDEGVVGHELATQFPLVAAFSNARAAGATPTR